jgi:hypothetical protein
MRLEHSSIDRAAINRENSLKSTGPKSDAGKKRSSLNALRHGLSGQVVVLPSEDLSAFERFTQTFHDDLKPSGALEKQLVHSIAGISWRLNRAETLENNLFTLGTNEKSDSILTENDQARDALAMVLALREQTPTLSALSLHQNRLARTLERNINQLRAIQAERAAREADELYDAGQLYLLHEQENKDAEAPQPYDPTYDGFVFSLDRIKQYVHLRRRTSQVRTAGISYLFSE